MLTYDFTDMGADTLYEYLYKCIKKDILEGKLAAGERLPSKRPFAKNLGISVITIENAYAQLMAEGYITSIPKKGFYVSNLDFELLDHEELAVDKENEEEKGNKKVQWFADFASNQTEPERFPFSIWTRLIRELISEDKDRLMKNSPPGGILALREAIAGHLLSFRGMHVEPEQIIVGAGTEYLYGLLVQLLGYDKIYGVEDPGYKKIHKVYQSNHVTCELISLDEDGICPATLEKKGVDVVHISPSHHYPTGMVTPVSRRYEILGWANKKEGRYIIEDDYDSEFRLLGKPMPSLQSIDVIDKVIYMNTFTKSLASTIRISYMVLPKSLMQQFKDQLSFYSCTVSNFEQYTLARFIEKGYLEKHINRMRSHYRKLRDRIISLIKAHPAAAAFHIMEEDAGLHFLMKVDTDLDDASLVDRAAGAGIRILCLSDYYHAGGQTGARAHTLVMNYSGIAEEILDEAVDRLCCSLTKQQSVL